MSTWFQTLACKPRIVVSLAASAVHVAYCIRGFKAWNCVRVADIALPQSEQEVDQLAARLREATQGWSIPEGAWVSWVLPADVLGVMRRSKQESETANLAGVIPFEEREVCVSERRFGPGAVACTQFWLHRDWLSAFERVSKSLGWMCDEVYARAQLMAPQMVKATDPVRWLIEGHEATAYLHAYAANGALLSSATLVRGDADALRLSVNRHIDALAAKPAANQHLTALNLANTEVEALCRDFAVVSASACTWPHLVTALLASGQEGLEVSSSYAYLHARLQFYALLLGLVGSVLVAGVLWHDSGLRKQISADAASVRDLGKTYLAVRQQRQDTMRLATATSLGGQLVAQPSAFESLSSIMLVLPPGGRILLFQQTGDQVELRGSGLDGHEISKVLAPLPSFTNIQAVESSKVKPESAAPEFHVKLRLQRPVTDAMPGVGKGGAP